ncbi:MAG TPA: glycosyl hydrolase [Acetobacteraceae bacterium]|nr:glycosyl hydrolase [Acetobacteraceae bacterium]
MASTTSYPLGVFVGSPNAAFEGQYASFQTALGATPGFMDAFTDFTQAPADWASNANWTASSWVQDGLGGTTPVIGIPMASSTTTDADSFFQAITAGTYDSVYKGIVDSWVAQGYTTLYLRLGYEMNTDGYMPWSVGSSAQTGADFVAAFQHLATLMHQEAAADGATAKIVWNPATINTTPQNTANLYPGNSYVDVVAADTYSPAYPLDLYNWASNNGSYAGSESAWAANPLNLEHFWEYPNATAGDPTGAASTSGWSVQDTINLAEQQGKPVGIAETGVGSTSGNFGPTDDPAFVAWLASTVSQSSVPVSFVNIWDVAVGDGNWDFSSAGATRPATAAAWQQYFGRGSTVGAQPMLVSVSGSTTAEVVVGPGNLGAILTTTDINGRSLAMPAVTSGAQNWYASQTGLAGNVHQWMDSSGTVNLSTDTWNLVNTAAIGDTTGGSFSLSNFVEVDATLTGASTSAASSLTIDNAKRGTISLGSGNYNMTFHATAGTSVAADNTVNVTMGSGNDNFVLDGSNGYTVANVIGGSGNDTMSFLNTGSVTVTAGSGATDVTGAGAADTYVFHPTSGVLTVHDFAPGRGDVLDINSSLESSLQMGVSGGNTVLNFGSGHEIILAGTTTDVSSAIKWV